MVRQKAPAPLARPHPKREGAYLTIAEMAASLGVATHVLRFWETKFPRLQPMKAAGGRRFYHPEAAAMARQIRDLLYLEKLTIPGAQAAIAKQKLPLQKAAAALEPATLMRELEETLAVLEGRA